MSKTFTFNLLGIMVVVIAQKGGNAESHLDVPMNQPKPITYKKQKTHASLPDLARAKQ